MAHVVVLGAGLGGTIMAYELRDALAVVHDVSVVTKGTQYSFVPSNPWVAVGWRDRKSVTIDLEPVFERRNIGLYPEGARRVHPAEKRIELMNGESIDYDYLVIATGPELAFDEIEGFGPEHNTQSVCNIDHALSAKPAFDALVANPGPVVIGAVQGASCFGPAYPKTGFMIESMVTATAQNIASLINGTEPTAIPTWGECRLPCRLRRQRRRLRRPAPDPSAQRQLVVPGQVGPLRQGGIRKVLPSQDAVGYFGTLLRAPRHEGSRHRQAQGGCSRRMTPVHVTVFSDVLCIWAYVAQARIDEVHSVFGDEVLLAHRRITLFGDTVAKFEDGWRDRGGFEGYAGARPLDRRPLSPCRPPPRCLAARSVPAPR